MKVFQTYKNICREITQHSCMTPENLGSFCCLISPKNVGTNWQKVPAGPLPLCVKGFFAVAKVLVQLPAVGARN